MVLSGTYSCTYIVVHANHIVLYNTKEMYVLVLIYILAMTMLKPILRQLGCIIYSTFLHVPPSSKRTVANETPSTDAGTLTCIIQFESCDGVLTCLRSVTIVLVVTVKRWSV